MGREMRHQGKVDQFGESDRLNDVGGLAHGNVLARARLLPGLRCRFASDKRNSAADPAVPLCMINPPELTN